MGSNPWSIYILCCGIKSMVHLYVQPVLGVKSMVPFTPCTCVCLGSNAWSHLHTVGVSIVGSNPWSCTCVCCGVKCMITFTHCTSVCLGSNLWSHLHPVLVSIVGSNPCSHLHPVLEYAVGSNPWFLLHPVLVSVVGSNP